MAYQYSNQYSRTVAYQFGFPSDPAQAPDFGPHFFARSGEFRYEAEVFAQAQEGEGHTDAIVTDKPEFRKCTATVTGYIEEGFSQQDIAPLGYFDFTQGTDERRFIVRNISVPRRKGEFSEVSVEAESYGLIDTSSVIT